MKKVLKLVISAKGSYANRTMTCPKTQHMRAESIIGSTTEGSTAQGRHCRPWASFTKGVWMLRLTLNAHPGKLVWASPDAPKEIVSLPALWGAAEGTFAPKPTGRKGFPRLDVSCVSVEGSSIHGRSCYLGQCPAGRHYFAKGVGWVHSAGWEPSHGSMGIVPRWAAERERDFAFRFSELGITSVHPEAIIAHQVIPDTKGGSPRRPDEVPDLDGTPAMPCMYVYSAACRWRLADLFYLTEAERDSVWGTGDDREAWLKDLLSGLGRSSRLLHAAGGHDYSLSTHNAFCDGTRVDFECSYLPDMPHPNPALNTDCEVWRDKERDGLRELSWQIAELMRLNVPVSVVTDWWRHAYESDGDRTTSMTDDAKV